MHVCLQDDAETLLEDFLLLSRLGATRYAARFIDVVLQPYQNLFPVFAECTEFFFFNSDGDKLQHWFHAIENVLDQENDELVYFQGLELLLSTSIHDLQVISENHQHEWYWLFRPSETDLTTSSRIHICEIANYHFASNTTRPEQYLQYACGTVRVLLEADHIWESARVFEAICKTAAKHRTSSLWLEINALHTSLAMTIGIHDLVHAEEDEPLEVYDTICAMIVSHAQLRFETAVVGPHPGLSTSQSSLHQLEAIVNWMNNLFAVCPVARADSSLLKSLQHLETDISSKAEYTKSLTLEMPKVASGTNYAVRPVGRSLSDMESSIPRTYSCLIILRRALTIAGTNPFTTIEELTLVVLMISASADNDQIDKA